MRRREFVGLLGSGDAALPCPASFVHSRGGRSRLLPTFWHAANAKEKSPYYEALIEGFSRLGYIEGSNFRLLHRFPNEKPEQFRSMAAELVSMKVDVLMGGALTSTYLRDATKIIPIVFMFIPDPVGMKFVQTLARPGGNATGLANFGSDIAGKRLQLLQELVPGLSRVGILTSPDNEVNQLTAQIILRAGKQLGLTLQTFDAASVEEIEPAFDEMVKTGMQGVILAQGGLAFQARHIIAEVSARTASTIVRVFKRDI